VLPLARFGSGSCSRTNHSGSNTTHDSDDLYLSISPSLSNDRRGGCGGGLRLAGFFGVRYSQTVQVDGGMSARHVRPIPRDLGTIAALVFAAVLVVLVIIGAILLIAG
jgi:hypothetical protein